MTRKDYVALADALRRATPLPSDGKDAMRTWGNVVTLVARVLANDNARFDLNRFYAAAGVEGVE